MVNSITRAAIDRRKLLVGTSSIFAAGIMTRAATIDALAQDEAAAIGRLFFTAKQAADVEAIAEVIWPTTETSAGGRDAGVMNYIDRALAGPYSDYRNVYVAGLEWLDFASNQAHGAAWAELDEDQQLDVVTQIFDGDLGAITAVDTYGSSQATPGSESSPEAATPMTAATAAAATPVAGDEQESAAIVDGVMVPGTTPAQAANLAAFLDVVRVHVMEGLFSDPAHGGNRDFAGWAAVGYPGPYVVFTEEQQQSFEPLNLPFQSIADF